MRATHVTISITGSISIAVSITGIHEWQQDSSFKFVARCAHGAIEESKPLLKKESDAFVQLTEVIKNKNLRKAYPHMIKNVNTARVESWNWIKLVYKFGA